MTWRVLIAFLTCMTVFAGAFIAAPAAEPVADADQAIVDLYKSGKLFDKAQYAKVRTAFANAFAQKHDEEIRKAFGKDSDELMAWLEKNQELKEELFTALLEERDDLSTAFRLVHEFWKK